MKILSLLFSAVLLLISACILVAVFVVASIMMLPDVHLLETCFTTGMYQVHLCPGSDSYVNLKDISPYVLHAVIVSEDGSFYTHDGFDWHEMEESLNADLQSGHFRRGGSTLTQQLAKNAFLDKEKSLWRKLKEAYLAHAIEKHYTKNFILEKYLNVVEFGEDIYGVKAAASHYFHKAPRDLNPLEAAYLAFLLPNPKGYSKSFRAGKLTPFARKMVSVILKRMSAYGKLSPDGYQAAMAELPNFPWSGLSNNNFRNAPSANLEVLPPAGAPAAAAAAEPQEDEKLLDELYNEDEGKPDSVGTGAAPAAPPTDTN